jgi:hypothetical protein
VTLPLRPQRGGFLRAFGCGWFIKEFLLGHGPFDMLVIDSSVGAPQADIFRHYKNALRSTTAYDRATKTEEKRARRAKRPINPDNIESLAQLYLKRMPYKAFRCRYHSFIVYFSNLQRLGWVEESGKEEPSAFQDNYAPGPPRKYYRLTEAGKNAGELAWANPRLALYPKS